ncbi:MAG TPA: GNAT family N-acetyltransferase [Chthoniobacterales bacterium]|nr:GNAT family N-acetyltransferase [Chthoniobacterales bacterium]
MLIRSPATDPEFEIYYRLRWKILREPWNQPPGSEKDDCEAGALHLAAWKDSGTLIGVGRLHRLSANVGQIRYMAVDPSERGRGVGAAILRELENLAAQSGFDEVMLNAREEAVSFYKSNGYVIVQPSHSLFGVIPHFEMRKRIR